MGLAVEVGALAGLAEVDPEGAEWLEQGLAVANRLLAEAGLPQHTEPVALAVPPSRASLCSFPYSFIHYLRYAYAHRVADPAWTAAPLPDSLEPCDDPIVQRELERMSSHLVCHSDAEGYYLPVEFTDLLFDEADELPGGVLGSSYRLASELVFVAPALGIALQNGQLSDEEAARVDTLSAIDEGLYREHAAWLALYEAARLSIACRTAIVFT